jgi:drug/metabolite transporter (DMT)-like permease
MAVTKLKAHIYLLIATLLFGVNYWVSKSLMPEFLNPPQIIFLRGIGAVVLFWLYSLSLPREKVSLRDMFILALCSLFGVALNQILFFEGLNLSGPVDAAIIHVINPLMVLLAAAILIRERITWLTSIGILTGLAGALLLVAYGKEIEVNPDRTKGNVMIILNTMCYAIYLVLAKPLLRRYHPVTIMSRVFFFGLLFTIPYFFRDVASIQYTKFTPYIWFAVFYLVVVITFFAYLLTITALRYLSTATVSYYIYLQPLIVSFMSLAMGRDLPGWHQAIAAILIFGGVYLVNRKQIKAYTDSRKNAA